jgi:hypothetical protein
MTTKKMQGELRRLFGEPLVRLAESTDPMALELTAGLMDRVHDGADALLTMRGDTEEQHRYVLALPHEVRLALCMWLMDTGLASKLVRAVFAKAS